MYQSPDSLVHIDDVASLCGISKPTVRQWCRRGLLKGAFQACGKGKWMIPRRALDEMISGDAGRPWASGPPDQDA